MLTSSMATWALHMVSMISDNWKFVESKQILKSFISYYQMKFRVMTLKITSIPKSGLYLSFIKGLKHKGFIKGLKGLLVC